MKPNVVLFAWDRPIPGREKISGQHFGEVVEYLASQQQKGTIQSFDAVLLDPHGGDLNGFFLIRGEPDRLAELLSTDEWEGHTLRARLHLNGLGIVRGYTGEPIDALMSRWKASIPD